MAKTTKTAKAQTKAPRKARIAWDQVECPIGHGRPGREHTRINAAIVATGSDDPDTLLDAVVQNPAKLITRSRIVSHLGYLRTREMIAHDKRGRVTLSLPDAPYKYAVSAAEQAERAAAKALEAKALEAKALEAKRAAKAKAQAKASKAQAKAPSKAQAKAPSKAKAKR